LPYGQVDIGVGSYVGYVAAQAAGARQLQRGQWDAAFLAEPYASMAEEDYGQVELADLDQAPS
jgi:ABC-type nitrate/sulfonate/bicarbonate transport system substrate-binding protein